uniref:Sialate O-acetylesterase domain-containing protein n=2 Tax=Oryza brachyantha TaxID=4533 RepID=J3LUY8_ORYBR
MAFANAVRASRAIPASTVIGLVPCAQGGTPIANWSRGTELYERMVTRARVAMASGGRVGALLWYQGEADTIRREDAEVYAGRMEAMVRDVRRELALPELLVIQVGIATGQGKFIKEVREAQKAVRLPWLKYVDAKGLPIASDYTHLTTPAQVRLGKLLANAYLSTL